MTFTHALSTNDYGPAKLIVSTNPANGTHTTLTSAMAAATAGDTIFVRTGTYTENITLVAGVNISAFNCDSLTPNVTLDGYFTGSYLGTVSISGINIANSTVNQPNIILIGTNNSVLNLINCNIQVVTSTSVGIRVQNTGTKINLYNCTADNSGNGQLFAVGTGSTGNFLNFYNCTMYNSSNSTNLSNINGNGFVNIYNSLFYSAITTTGGLSIYNSTFITPNVTAISAVTSSPGPILMQNCSINSGSASALTINSGGTATVTNLTVYSTNTNAITGAGTLNYGPITFTGSSSLVNVSTQNPLRFGPSISPEMINTNGTVYYDGTILNSANPGTSGEVLTSNGSGLAPSYQANVAASRFPITPYVVGPIGNAGYQTIQSAMDAAHAAGGGSIYIQTGNYTENLVFYPDVQLVGVTGNSDETGMGTDITITGTHTPSDTGYTTISNIYLESAGDIFFSTDPGTCVIALQNCNIGITGSGYTFNLVNWTGQLNKYDVQDNSINNGVVNNTAGAPCFFENSNMGKGSVSSMITSGLTTMKRIHLSCPWSAGSGTIIIADFATFEYTVTMNGTAGGEFNFCRFSPSVFSSDPGLIWNSSALVLELEMCIIDRTGTYAIDGTGTGNLVIGSVGFVQVTTINPAINTVALGGFIPNAFGTAGQVWTSNGQGVVPTFQDNAEVNASLGFYGDGSDGSVTFDGSTVVLGITPSLNIYTLARDIFLNSSTINSGVSIITNGFRIFCKGTLSNNGTIQFNGNAGTNTGIGGIALANTSSSLNSSSAGGASISTAGGAGNTGVGSIGTNASISPTFGGTGQPGGAGGSAGGNGGNAVSLSSTLGSLRALPMAATGILFSGTDAVQRVGAGTGGGGGGGDGVNKGGGGGSGGGIVLLCVYLFAGTGNIQALGGNGGNGTTSAINCGGGGGGGGGLIIIISRSVSAGSISGQSVSVSGGTPGNGTGLGNPGTMGNTGTTILLSN